MDIMASKKPLNTCIGFSLLIVCCSQESSLGNANGCDKPIRKFSKWNFSWYHVTERSYFLAAGFMKWIKNYKRCKINGCYENEFIGTNFSSCLCILRRKSVWLGTASGLDTNWVICFSKCLDSKGEAFLGEEVDVAKQLLRYVVFLNWCDTSQRFI